ncbi:MAG: CobW family GTP-binding protein [Pseudomonadales bacterium]
MTEHSELIPITVIAGYLGAGKTTLINRMLHAARSPFAVIVNDLGELAVDVNLISERRGDIVSLTNGCACCQISQDLAAQLSNLRDAGFDAVVLEASGVARASALRQVTSQAEGYTLAKVVTLVDGTALDRLLNDRYLADLVKAQIEAADLVYQTKVEARALWQQRRSGEDRTPSTVAEPEVGQQTLIFSQSDSDSVLRRSEAESLLHPVLQRIAPSAKHLPSAGELPENLAVRFVAALEVALEKPEPVPQFNHRVVYPRKGLDLSDLEAFIRRNPQIERAKGWIDSSEGVVLVQATRSFFNVSRSEAPKPSGLQLIWRGAEPPLGDECVLI